MGKGLICLQSPLTIIYPATVDWFLLFQRPQQLLTAFSKIPGVRCIFETTEFYQKLQTPVVKVKEDLFLVKHRYDYRHLIQGKKVLWFSFPAHYRNTFTEKYDLVVFDAIDNPVGEFSEWAKDMPEAIKVADLISCTANVMYESHKLSGKPVFMCPNGSDFDHFSKASTKLEKPSDFPKLSRKEKVIGFYGAMAEWVDFDLILYIASRYKVVLIGSNKFYSCPVTHPNIFSLHHKDYSILPNYLSHFDITLIPFKLTEMIKGCDPIKFYEYLAAGKPVLATEIEELKKYANVTYFINHNNALDVIDRALREDCEEKKRIRQEIVKEQSWDRRAEIALRKINELLQ